MSVTDEEEHSVSSTSGLHHADVTSVAGLSGWSDPRAPDALTTSSPPNSLATLSRANPRLGTESEKDPNNASSPLPGLDGRTVGSWSTALSLKFIAQTSAAPRPEVQLEPVITTPSKAFDRASEGIGVQLRVLTISEPRTSHERTFSFEIELIQKWFDTSRSLLDNARDEKCGLVIYSGEITIKTETERCFMQSQIGSIKQCSLRVHIPSECQIDPITFPLDTFNCVFSIESAQSCASYYWLVRNSAQLHELHQDKQFTPLIIFYRNSTSQLSQMSFGPNSIAVEFRFRRRLWPALLHVFLLPSALLVLVCAALWLPIAQTTANLLPASRLVLIAASLVALACLWVAIPSHVPPTAGWSSANLFLICCFLLTNLAILETALALVLVHRRSESGLSGTSAATTDENEVETIGISSAGAGDSSCIVADRSFGAPIEEWAGTSGSRAGVRDASLENGPPEFEAHAAYYSPRRVEGQRALLPEQKTDVGAGVNRSGRKRVLDTAGATKLTYGHVISPTARHVNVFPRVEDGRTKFCVAKANFIDDRELARKLALAESSSSPFGSPTMRNRSNLAQQSSPLHISPLPPLTPIRAGAVETGCSGVPNAPPNSLAHRSGATSTASVRFDDSAQIVQFDLSTPLATSAAASRRPLDCLGPPCAQHPLAGTYVAVPVSLTPAIQRCYSAAAPCVAQGDAHGVAQLGRLVLAGVGADTGAAVARCCFNSLMESSYHYCPAAADQQTQLQQLEQRQQMQQQPSLFRTLSITPTQSSPLRESTEHSLVPRASSSSPTVLNLFCFPLGCLSGCVCTRLDRFFRYSFVGLVVLFHTLFWMLLSQIAKQSSKSHLADLQK